MKTDAAMIRDILNHAIARAQLGQTVAARRFVMNCIVAIESTVPHSEAWSNLSSHLQDAIIGYDDYLEDRLIAVKDEARFIV